MPLFLKESEVAWVEKGLEAAKDGVYVYGIFLEGARYSKETSKLAECEPKVLFVDLPMMWLRPTKLDDIVVEPPEIVTAFERYVGRCLVLPRSRWGVGGETYV